MDNPIVIEAAYSNDITVVPDTNGEVILIIKGRRLQWENQEQKMHTIEFSWGFTVCDLIEFASMLMHGEWIRNQQREQLAIIREQEERSRKRKEEAQCLREGRRKLSQLRTLLKESSKQSNQQV